MTLTIELSPEEEIHLRQQAGRRGEDVATVARAFVQAGLSAAPAADLTDEKHAVLIQHLRDAGLLRELPTQSLGPPPPLITVLGPPVSQTLLQDRE